jgi:hypothetical protein
MAKIFLRTTKNRLVDPSEICALEFKGEIRRLGVCSVSATIGIDRSIFSPKARKLIYAGTLKKTVTRLSITRARFHPR